MRVVALHHGCFAGCVADSRTHNAQSEASHFSSASSERQTGRWGNAAEVSGGSHVRSAPSLAVLWHLSEALAGELFHDELAACQFALALLRPRAEA